MSSRSSRSCGRSFSQEFFWVRIGPTIIPNKRLVEMLSNFYALLVAEVIYDFVGSYMRL